MFALILELFASWWQKTAQIGLSRYGSIDIYDFYLYSMKVLIRQEREDFGDDQDKDGWELSTIVATLREEKAICVTFALRDFEMWSI